MLGFLGWGVKKNRVSFETPFNCTDGVLSPPRGAGTFTRASAQYVTDHEGVVRKVESGSPAIEGSRVVTNLLTYSEDLSNAAWTKGGTCTVTGTNVVNFPNPEDTIRQQVTNISGSAYRGTYTLSGSGTITLYLSSGATAYKKVTLNSTPTKYSLNLSGATAGSIYLYLFRRTATGDTATSVTVHSAQLENVTAQSNQNPGEYVKTTSAAVTKCFSTTNGNTVDANGVVTEGVGTALTTIKGPLLETASTNKCTAYGIIPADTLGSELTLNNSFTDTSVWSTETGWAISGGLLNATAATAATYQGALSQGKLYTVTYTISNYVSGTVKLLVGTTSTPTVRSANGTYTETLLCSGTPQIRIQGVDAFTGSIDNVSVKEVTWATGTKSYYNGTAFQQNITGLTLLGDTAAVLSIVDDTAAVTAAGLLGVNPTGKVYKLDNSAGSANAYLVVGGQAGNTNKHSYGCYVRGVGYLNFYSQNGTVINSTEYTRLNVENVTPVYFTDNISFAAEPGQVFHFLLPQLEESSSASSICPSAGGTCTRAATVLSYLITGIWNTTLSAEKITVEDDRTFASDTGWWSKDSGVTISGGVAAFSAVANGSGIYKTAQAIVGRKYEVTFTTAITSGGIKYSNSGTVRTTSGTYTEQIVAATTSIGWFASGTFTGSIDNVSIKEVQSIPSGSGTLYVTFNNVPTSLRFFLGSYLDANNSIGLGHDGTNFVFRKRVGGSNFDATKAQAITPGTPYRVGWRINPDYSTDLAVDSVLGTGNDGLSAEKITNGEFSSWSDGNPVGWSVTETAPGSVEESSGKCRLYSPAGEAVLISQESLISGRTYAYSFDISSITGTMVMTFGAATDVEFTTTGTKSGTFTATATTFALKRKFGATCDATIDNVSVKEVALSPPAVTTTFRLGDDGNGTNGAISSQIKDFKIYRRALPDARL